MARPALSAARALEIVDLMAGVPDRPFTLSELVRATNSNFASCHAVLTTLVARAWLVRDEARKSYRLGPALFAAGQAMAQHDEILGIMTSAAEGLAERTGLVLAISARTQDEMVGISRHGAAEIMGRGLQAGERVPLRPPIGATLMAWSDDREIDLWIGRGGLAADCSEAVSLRAQLAAIRRRGYLATLDSDGYAALSAAVSLRNRGESVQIREDQFISGLFGDLSQPDRIEGGASYDLAYIGAPVFDRAGRPIYSLVLSGFKGRIDGRTLEGFATELTRLCTDVMRSGAHSTRFAV